MTNIGILIITIGVIITTLIICVTIFIMSWYNIWRREAINGLKKCVGFHYNVANKGSETDNISNKEFKTIITAIKQIVDKL